jgi:hypothetical protein
MSSDMQAFTQFMQQREAAALAYVGDAIPLGRLVAHQSPATFFPPRGGYTEGAEEVETTYTQDATSFAPGGIAPLKFCKWTPVMRLAIGSAFSVQRPIYKGKPCLSISTCV